MNRTVLNLATLIIITTVLTGTPTTGTTTSVTKKTTVGTDTVTIYSQTVRTSVSNIDAVNNGTLVGEVTTTGGTDPAKNDADTLTSLYGDSLTTLNITPDWQIELTEKGTGTDDKHTIALSSIDEGGIQPTDGSIRTLTRSGSTG